MSSDPIIFLGSVSVLPQIPDWLPELERLDAYWGEFDRTFAPDFKRIPDILVIHSASFANWPAEFLENPICNPNKGHICPDGKNRSVAAAHFCFYQGRTNKLRYGTIPPKQPMQFVQMVSLRHSAPHVGGSTCLGDHYVNGRSYGIELPARFNAYDSFQNLLDILLPAVPSLNKWTTHREIHDKKRKTDPVKGSGFSEDWMEGRGLTFVGREPIKK